MRLSSVAINVVTSLVTALITSFVTSVIVWSWQQGQLQRWNSRVVVDITITPKKILTIHNAGVVDVTDANIFFTEYVLDGEIREGGHLYLKPNIRSFSKASLDFHGRVSR